MHNMIKLLEKLYKFCETKRSSTRLQTFHACQSRNQRKANSFSRGKDTSSSTISTKLPLERIARRNSQSLHGSVFRRALQRGNDKLCNGLAMSMAGNGREKAACPKDRRCQCQPLCIASVCQG